ncbi:Nicotinate phosphoribosyltransferase [Brevibacillus laterosporus]|nr:hypothetical protein [Brevibacillus laterosporus]RAP26090.1 Nicotinate phosphoribosyltransferase [Brevibacillus laterosporus]
MRKIASRIVTAADGQSVIEIGNNAITVAKRMEERGQKLTGIRLDSGDLAFLSKRARKMLDNAGFPNVKKRGKL